MSTLDSRGEKPEISTRDQWEQANAWLQSLSQTPRPQCYTHEQRLPLRKRVFDMSTGVLVCRPTQGRCYYKQLQNLASINFFIHRSSCPSPPSPHTDTNTTTQTNHTETHTPKKQTSFEYTEGEGAEGREREGGGQRKGPSRTEL